MTGDPETAPLLTVYSRAWCHLCEDLLAALAPLREEFGFELQVVDVDAHPELEERYGELVPVLVAGEAELCHYFLDAAAVRAYLLSFR
ncbi:MAG: glutaredoxin family protein [Rhodocyclales bacterium]|nr:glutaredoxin family protein [Rhodocyclales bacterium]